MLLRRSRSFKVTEFGTNRKLTWDFLLVINSNFTSNLASFLRYSLRKVETRYIRLPHLRLTPPTNGVWNDLRKILGGCQRTAKVPNGVDTTTYNYSVSSRWLKSSRSLSHLPMSFLLAHLVKSCLPVFVCAANYSIYR